MSYALPPTSPEQKTNPNEIKLLTECNVNPQGTSIYIDLYVFLLYLKNILRYRLGTLRKQDYNRLLEIIRVRRVCGLCGALAHRF